MPAGPTAKMAVLQREARTLLVLKWFRFRRNGTPALVFPSGKKGKREAAGEG